MPGEAADGSDFNRDGGEVHTAESRTGLEMLGQASIENVQGHQLHESFRKSLNRGTPGDDGWKGG